MGEVEWGWDGVGLIEESQIGGDPRKIVTDRKTAIKALEEPSLRQNYLSSVDRR